METLFKYRAWTSSKPISIINAMSKVQYRSLGKSGLKVSVPIVSYKTLIDNPQHSPLINILHSLVQWALVLRNGLYVIVPCSIHQILNFLQPWVLDEEPSIEILKAAWDLGINTIDTANVYSNGESERVIAKFIKKVCLTDVLNLHSLMYRLHSTTFLAPRS